MELGESDFSSFNQAWKPFIAERQSN